MSFQIVAANDPAHATACGHVLADHTALVLSETGSANIVDLAGSVHALTPVAADMIVLTLENGREAAIDLLVERYDAPRECIADDLDRLWNDFVDRGLIRQADGLAANRSKSRSASAAASLADIVLAAPLPFKARAAIVLALVKFSCRHVGLAATIGAWRERFGTGGVADPDAIADDAKVVHDVATRHWLKVDCKERALTSWAVARRKGIDATVVIGLKPYPLAGHAWCRVADRIVGDDPDFCAAHSPVFEFSKA